MAKFANVQSDVEAVFATAAWTAIETAHNIKAVPANFQAPNTSDQFVRINILPGQSFNTAGGEGHQGMVRIDVFAEAGYGPGPAFEICDAIDTVLSNQVLNNRTQTYASTASVVGLDPDNPSLFRVNYSVPYRHFT